MKKLRGNIFKNLLYVKQFLFETSSNGRNVCIFNYVIWIMFPGKSTGKSHGRKSLVGCSPWGRSESDTTERLHFHFLLSCIGEGNGNPLQCSCLENVYGVAQSRTWLKWLSSSHSCQAFSRMCRFFWLIISCHSLVWWTHTLPFWLCTVQQYPLELSFSVANGRIPFFLVVE